MDILIKININNKYNDSFYYYDMIFNIKVEYSCYDMYFY